MPNRQAVRSRRRRRRHDEDQPADQPAPAPHAAERLGPQYSAGPIHELSPRAAKAAEVGAKQATEDEVDGASPAAAGELSAAEPEAEKAPAGAVAGAVSQLPALSSKESRRDQEVVAYGRTVRLRGRTDSGPFNFEAHTEDVQAARATGCTGCAAADCLRVTGTVVATYSVSPTVTLPSLSDYPDLTPCQQRRVQNAIDTVLAPHEQQHVTAFQTYNGTTRSPFELTICRSGWNQSAIDALVHPEQAARQAAAQAASDALDPFFFDVDLDCQEPQAPRSQTTGGGEAPVSAGERQETETPV